MADYLGKTRQELEVIIRNALISKSALWSNLSGSLVGKELISWAAEHAYGVNTLLEGIGKINDLSRSSYEQVLAFCYTHNISVPALVPSSITVTIPDDGTSWVAQPYSLSYQKGNIFYTNIDFVRKGQQITLYQGVPCKMQADDYRWNLFVSDSASNTALPSVFQKRSRELYSTFTRQGSGQRYMKLGPTAFNSSVWVLNVNDEGYEYPLTEYNSYYTPFSETTVIKKPAQFYKIRQGWDRSINVYFGDNGWDYTDTDISKVAVFYLEGTIKPLSIDTPSIQLSQVGSNTKLTATVVSIAEGAEQTVESLVNRVQLSLADSIALVTKEQIKRYCDIQPQVNSSQVLSSVGSGVVTIKVKPAEQGETRFGWLQEQIVHRASPGVEYTVTAGTPVIFSIVLANVVEPNEGNMTRAISAVTMATEYSALNILSTFSTSTINSILGINAVQNVYGWMRIKRNFIGNLGSYKLEFTPTPGSLSIKNSAGKITAYDENGILVSANSEKGFTDFTYINSNQNITAQFAGVFTIGSVHFIKGVNSEWNLVANVAGKSRPQYKIRPLKDAFNLESGEELISVVDRFRFDTIGNSDTTGGIVTLNRKTNNLRFRVFDLRVNGFFEEQGDNSIVSRTTKVIYDVVYESNSNSTGFASWGSWVGEPCYNSFMGRNGTGFQLLFLVTGVKYSVPKQENDSYCAVLNLNKTNDGKFVLIPFGSIGHLGYNSYTTPSGNIWSTYYIGTSPFFRGVESDLVQSSNYTGYVKAIAQMDNRTELLIQVPSSSRFSNEYWQSSTAMFDRYDLQAGYDSINGLMVFSIGAPISVTAKAIPLSIGKVQGESGGLTLKAVNYFTTVLMPHYSGEAVGDSIHSTISKTLSGQLKLTFFCLSPNTNRIKAMLEVYMVGNNVQVGPWVDTYGGMRDLGTVDYGKKTITVTTKVDAATMVYDTTDEITAPNGYIVRDEVLRGGTVENF